MCSSAYWETQCTDSLVQPVETYGVCSKRVSSKANQISDSEKFPPSTKRFSSFCPAPDSWFPFQIYPYVHII